MNHPPIRCIDLRKLHGRAAREALCREWLITNGLGGYASGAISGMVARRYHGLLVASLAAPRGRMVMFNHLAEYAVLPDGERLKIGGYEPGPEEGERRGTHFVTEFRLENGLPFWRYEFGAVLEKSMLMVHGQNTTHVSYRLVSGGPVTLELHPSLHFRDHHHDVAGPDGESYQLVIRGPRYEVHSDGAAPPLRLCVQGSHATFSHHGGDLSEIVYQMEADRGYPSRGRLWSPGAFTMRLSPARREGHLIASTEPWAVITALSPDEALESELKRRRHLLEAAPLPAREGPAAELVLAADQFLITPAGRAEESAQVLAAGVESRTVIAGYHWFTDWGRDTMISLEGLTLSTGRHQEAASILRTFAMYVRDGLIPNLFPEGQDEGLYHTADATLWFFHAVDRYADVTGDRQLIRDLLPTLSEILDHHQRGTKFGIGMDPEDGLLRQGAEGYQLTWMDAKVDGWVVTPRRGKAVEINALWYNALRLMEAWLRTWAGELAAQPLGELAIRARESFNRRFWSDRLGYLKDVVDGENGDDEACRPNQVLALSLRHPVLEEAHWTAVLHKVREELLTPVGLRSLSRAHPDYKPRYFGDLRARDAAYHQGTVWAWLIGPFIDAWLKAYPEDRAGARKLLDGIVAHLDQGCVGSISEIFDAEEPFAPRGCIAQAWSVAEALRCWVKLGVGE